MSSTHYTRNTDDGNPYTMTYTNQRDSYYYNEPSLGTNQTSGYTDEKDGHFMDSNPDGLDDHSNVSQSRDEVNLGGSRTSGLAYNENESSRHLVDHTAEASLNDPLVPQQMRPYEDLEYAEPHLQGKPSGAGDGKLKNLFASARYPLDQRIQDKKRGIGRQRHPFVVYGLTVIMVAVFIYELVVNSHQQGSPISLKPVVNPMLGPSSSVLIHVGARFPPCMKLVEQVPPTTALPCMNDTANPVTSVCTVEDLCGFGGFHNETPNQWFRFITAIFLHAGFIHIILNMLAQLTLSAQIEREMGSGGFLITYFAAGIFGNVLGGNFSLVGVPSIGASGAIFGTVAVTWIDLLAHWKYQYRPVRKLIFMAIELLIGIAVGYIPYVDNFAHIGGFVMGLLVGTVFYPVISTTKRHRVIMWTFRLVAIPIAIILFVILVRNFYTSDPYAACSGCRYLSCFPSAANNHCKGTGLAQLLLNGWSDPNHCRALMNDGSWLDSGRQNWQPNGCMLHSYTEAETASCFNSKEIVFIGDSITRKLFFQTVYALDSALPTSPLDGKQKHANHKLQTRYGTNLTFIWDPFLNSSDVRQVLTKNRPNQDHLSSPALLVLGSGLWYLRYANDSGGISAWMGNMDRIFDLISVNNNQADGIVILPVETVEHSKLSPERASTMNPSDIDAMNSDLYHRINSPLNGFMSHSSARSNLSFPLVFNKMLHASLTEDGVHYSDSVVKIQAQILINLRCDNHHMPDKPPVDKTCCSLYPWPSLCQLLVLWSITIWAPYVAIRVSLDDIQRRAGDPRKAFSGRLAPYLVFSMSIALIYLADRTTLWEKEQKQFNAWTFGSLSVFALTIGFLSLQGSDTDLGFLNREQTEEWKGWMQIAILLYHYFGASKVSGIYNPIRVLVASYLFMTGYGHTMFYLRKADFGFTRLARVLIRLNLVTVVLPYTMNTDYISYYFTPLVSMWYIMVYATMSLGARFNDRIAILLAKILSSAVLMTWLMNDSWLLEALFDSLRSVFGIDWSVREWAFRVNLDIWIVYIGMLTALLVTKIREYHLDDHPGWSILVNMSVIASAFAMVWYFAFELSQESKFSYNSWHPYISFIPVLSFAILRNSTPLLRSTSSKAFAFVGRCSLETFIVQFHYWLAGDTKGVLLVVHGTQWRPLNFVITTIMFIYLSDRLAWATSNITSDICGNDQQSLPLPSSDSVIEQGDTTPSSPFTIKDEGINVPHVLEEPNATIWSIGDGEAISYARSIGHWLARQSRSWKLGAQILVFFMVLWLLNIVWPYSDVFKD